MMINMCSTDSFKYWKKLQVLLVLAVTHKGTYCWTCRSSLWEEPFWCRRLLQSNLQAQGDSVIQVLFGKFIQTSDPVRLHRRDLRVGV